MKISRSRVIKLSRVIQRSNLYYISVFGASDFASAFTDQFFNSFTRRFIKLKRAPI